MSLEIAVVQFQIPTSGSTIDITSSGFGTPVAAMFYHSASTANDGTAKTGATLGVGWTDGTNERCAAIQSEDNQGTSDTDRATRETSCLVSLTTSGLVDFELGFNSVITEGVRVDIDTLPSSSREVACVLIGGAGVSASAGTTTQSSGSVTTSIANDIVFTATTGDAVPSIVAHAILGFGCAVDDGLATNRGCLWASRTGVTTTIVNCRIETDSSVGQLFNNSLAWTTAITAFGATSFTKTASASGADEIIYLAIDSGGAELQLDTLETPTATGNDKTTTSFEVAGLIGVATNADALDNVEQGTNADSESVSIIAADAAAVWSAVVWEADGVATTNSESALDNTLLVRNGGAVHIEGTTSFQSDGYTVNYTTVDASIRYGWMLAIGAAAAGGVANAYHYQMNQ